MYIDKNKDYVIGSFRFRNFINLNSNEKLMILKERNHPDVKKWMFTNNDILEEDHICFINSLKNRNDAFYWLIERNGMAIGVLSIVKCDYDKGEGESGYYLFANYQKSGFGLELHYAYKKLFFNTFSFKRLLGHIQVGNDNSYYLTAFFGGKKNGIIEIDNQKYYDMYTDKEQFLNVLPDKLASRFIKFLKTSPKRL